MTVLKTKIHSVRLKGTNSNYNNWANIKVYKVQIFHVLEHKMMNLENSVVFKVFFELWLKQFPFSKVTLC